ncbi:MAG: ABC transporter substrate-binding protein [Gammaproteobacteria bacterium]|nr:ABC transporter substrate-binding protein [Gammaproteobacteria bacterium]
MLRHGLRKYVAWMLALSLHSPLWAQQEVKIGVIYPLTGASAAVGAELRNALELATDIINNGIPGLSDLPLNGGGLPNLKGAKLKLVFADHQANPQTGASEAERLISQEKVVALVGSYNSAVTATASQIAERSGIPFLNPESSSASLTQRGFKWFFRTTPHDDLFIHNAFEFLQELKNKKGITVGGIASLNENGLWGTETTKLQAKLAPEYKFNLVKQVSYPAKTTQLTSEVQTLKIANPKLLLQSSYTADAILSMKTYKELGFSPDMILANNAGFTDTDFIKTLGKDAEYIITREVWALDLANTNPLIKKVNDAYFSRYKINFTGNSSRTFTGLMVMADAINRAGSTDPEAIRKALVATHLPGNKLIMPWSGVKFDESGQNLLGRGILAQIVDGKYHTVWPFDMASRPVVWPMPSWDKR